MPDRPNVLIFVMDTQRLKNMSCYGYRRETTPNIDRIAAEGVLFENHIITASWTLPVHASLFTGKYACGHGAHERNEFLADDMPTMAEIFNRAGYRTCGITNNSWVGQNPANCARGFTEYYQVGELEAVPPYVPSDDPDARDNGSWKTVGVVQKWLGENAGAEQPFLLFINCTEPHDVYWPPEPFRSKFLLDGVSQEEAREIAKERCQVYATMGEVAYTAEEFEVLRSLVDGETATLDHRMGLLFDWMREQGILDETILIIISDHGDTIGEHAWHFAHSQSALWDSVIHTPLIMRHPGHFSGGRRVDPLVQTNDLLPGLMELLGIEDEQAAEEIQGVSFLPTVSGEQVREIAMAEVQDPVHPMERIWTYFPDFDVRFFNRAQKCARTRQWKYVWTSDMRDELYNIAKDPDEQFNIIWQKPEVARELRGKLEELLLPLRQRDYGDTRRYSPERHDPPEALRRLLAWGLARHVKGSEMIIGRPDE